MATLLAVDCAAPPAHPLFGLLSLAWVAGAGTACLQGHSADTAFIDWRVQAIMTEVTNASDLLLCGGTVCPGTDRLGGPLPSSSAHRLSTSELLVDWDWALEPDSTRFLCCSAAVLASQCRAPISPGSPAESEPAWAMLLLDTGLNSFSRLPQRMGSALQVVCKRPLLDSRAFRIATLTCMQGR